MKTSTDFDALQDELDEILDTGPMESSDEANPSEAIAETYWAGLLQRGMSELFNQESAAEPYHGRVNICWSNLTGLDLRGAHLKHAYLFGSDLSGSDLRGIDFTGATLDEANLEGADLRGATGLAAKCS